MNAVPRKTGIGFISINCSDFVSEREGDSEMIVRAIFEIAKERRPFVIFLDSIDEIFVTWKEENEHTYRVKRELLKEMTGIQNEQGILIIGATNRPYSVDKVFLPQFPKRVYVPMPIANERKQIIQQHLNGYRHSISVSELSKLAVTLQRFVLAIKIKLLPEKYFIPDKFVIVLTDGLVQI